MSDPVSRVDEVRFARAKKHVPKEAGCADPLPSCQLWNPFVPKIGIREEENQEHPKVLFDNELALGGGGEYGHPRINGSLYPGPSHTAIFQQTWKPARIILA